MTWLKKVLHLGIGERWLVISRARGCAGLPVGALVTLLVLGTGSLLYTSAGRTLRARVLAARAGHRPGARDRRWRRSTAPRCCPTASAGRSRAGRAAASGSSGCGRRCCARGSTPGCSRSPPLLPGAGPGAAACVLLLVVASHHYDDLYRVLNGLHPPGQAARLLGLGWPGRLLVVAVLLRGRRLGRRGGPVGARRRASACSTS